ncbi:MAG: hypothetical protein R3F31_20280 [Verrucomicrobiales bacterium]
MEGIFIGCLDAASGQQIWCNDHARVSLQRSHRAQAMGGVAPQGYLLIDGEELMVPCSQAYPAKFDLHSGNCVVQAAGRGDCPVDGLPQRLGSRKPKN